MMWIKQFLCEIGVNPKKIEILVDNEAAVELTKTQTFHRRSRHTRHRYHYIQELVQQKGGYIHRIGTNEYYQGMEENMDEWNWLMYT